MTTLLDTLRAIVGPAHVITEGDLSAWEQDWLRRVRGKALAVVRPASTQEVAAVVKACAAAGTAIVPQGGNTGLAVGSTPDDSGTQIVLSLTRMNAVRSVDTDNLTMTVEAGCILQNLQDVAQNAGDLCLGLEVVTAQGKVWDGLKGLRKDNTGYDLRDLFIGSEGTLGIITAATMKLYPQPAANLTAWAAVPSMEHAVALLGLAHKQLGAGLTGFEVMGQFALSLVDKHMPQLRVPFLGDDNAPWCVLLENSDSESEEHARARFESLLETAFEMGCVTDAVVAENLTQAHQRWHIRESSPLAQAEEGLNIKHDISVQISRIPAFVAHTDAVLQREIPGVRLVNFGHLGDGNLHYNVQAPAEGDPKAFLREHEAHVNHLVYEAVAEFGGSFSAEHGIGELKADKLEKYQSPVAMGMMRAIKQALDPQGIMNPGRVLKV